MAFSLRIYPYKAALSAGEEKGVIMFRFIMIMAYVLSITEMIFIAIVLLDISVPSRVSLKSISGVQPETMAWATKQNKSP